MNREILFRGFHPDEGQSEIYIERVYINGEWVKGKWVYGSHIHRTIYYGSPCDTHIIVEIGEFEYDDYASYEVIPETVGQYTGLMDKNGVKIFEGDKIASYRNVFVTAVEYIDYGFYPFTGKIFYPDECEVTGNIFSNPELLEGIE